MISEYLASIDTTTDSGLNLLKESMGIFMSLLLNGRHQVVVNDQNGIYTLLKLLVTA